MLRRRARRIGLALAAWRVLVRVGRRSGATDADLRRRLPGDELVSEPRFVADRVDVLPALAAEVWPWLVQAGKERGGWYMPAWLEPLIVRRPETKSATRIVPELQQLAVGDEVPDYGPGDPVFRVAVLDPPHALVYLTIRQPARNWTWPEPDDPLPPRALALSWALVLDDLGDGRTRLHVRVRARSNNRGRLARVTTPAMGLVDYVTTLVLVAGLRERLAATAAS